MQRLSWRFLVRRQLAGMVCVLAIPLLIGCAVNLGGGDSLVSSLGHSALDASYLLAIVVLSSPLSIVTLAAWMRIVARVPALERGWTRAVLSWLGLTLVFALLSGALSSWEAVIDEVAWSEIVRDTGSIARQVFPWALLGILLPRLLLPSLRPSSR